MITNSRAAMKEPREIGKKNPGKTYLPRFLDQSSKEDLKSSVERELADISMYMEKERQIIDKLVPGSIFKGTWDACSDKYPDGNDENSTWDVVVTCGKTHAFDGKVWEAGHELLYFSVSDTYVQRTNPGSDGIKVIIDEMKVEIDESRAIIQENKLAIAETNLALAEETKKLEASVSGVVDLVNNNKTETDGKIDENRQAIVEANSKIAITNQTIATLTETVATNKTELESQINGVITDVDGVKQGIVDANARIDITNQTVSNLEGSLASSVTELRAEYKAADAKVAGDAAADAQNKADKVAVEAAAALAVTNKTVADLDKAMSQNITALRSEYQAADSALDGKLTGSINKVAADLVITNETVASLEGSVALNMTQLRSEFTAADAVVKKDAEDDATAKADKVAVDAAAALAITNKTVADLDHAMSQNITELTSAYKAADAKVASDAAADATSKANKVAVDAAAALAITNQTVADLDKSLSQNITELTSAYKAADATVTQGYIDADGIVANNAAADATAKANQVAVDAAAALKITNETLATLEGTVATNMTQLRSEYQTADSALDGKLQGNINKVAADLVITNSTVADNYSSLSSSITNLTASYDGQIANINSSLSATANKVGNLEAKWTVQADVNGKISGIEMVNDGRTSNFTIQTDRFVVTDGVTTRPPFSIEGGKVAMKDAYVSGTIQANAGDMNNVTIRENCTVLGTLYANNIVGLPTGKRFGRIDVTTDTTAEKEVWAWDSPSAQGRFQMSALLGGRMFIEQTGQAIKIVKVLVNGNVAIEHHVNPSDGNHFMPIPGRAFGTGTNGSRISINISMQGSGRFIFQWHDPFVYNAIDI